MFSFLQLSRPIDGIHSDTIFYILGYKINNSTLFSVLILALLAVVCFFVIKRFRQSPGRLQILFEIIYGLVENLILQITGSKKETRIILPFIGAIFVFVLASNLLGIIPGITSITYDGKMLLRIPTADFSTTLALALASFVIIQILSVKDFGIFGYIGKYIKVKELYLGFRQGFKQGMLAMVEFFVGFLDIIGEVAKVASVSLRLFGNMYAGMVLATVMSGVLAYALPTFLVAMGLLVAVVQTIVFTALITVYYTMAVKIDNVEDL